MEGAVGEHDAGGGVVEGCDFLDGFVVVDLSAELEIFLDDFLGEKVGAAEGISGTVLVVGSEGDGEDEEVDFVTIVEKLEGFAEEGVAETLGEGEVGLFFPFVDEHEQREMFDHGDFFA